MGTLLPIARGAVKGALRVLRDEGILRQEEGTSGHVRLAGIVACSAAAAQCFAPSKSAVFVRIGGALVIAGIAASAAFQVTRRHSLHEHDRALLRMTVRHIVPRHSGSWAALALSVACDPPDLRSEEVRRRVLDRVRRNAWSTVVRPARVGIAIVGLAWGVTDVVRERAEGEIFVRDFEATAEAMCLAHRSSIASA
jgi:hypothetical protein